MQPLLVDETFPAAPESIEKQYLRPERRQPLKIASIILPSSSLLASGFAAWPFVGDSFLAMPATYVQYAQGWSVYNF